MQMPLGAGPEPPLVLLIEDANFNLHAERITLEAFGYRVINTEEGTSGLLLAKMHRPNLVILDLGLPDVSGVTVLTELKREPSTRAIPVLVCTADDSTATREETRAAGCSGYIVKPFSADEFLDAVRGVLETPSTPDPAGAA